MAVKKTASTGKSSAAAKTAAKKTAAKKPDAAKSTKAVKKPVVAPADPKVFISNDDAYWFGNGTHYHIRRKRTVRRVSSLLYGLRMPRRSMWSDPSTDGMKISIR